MSAALPLVRTEAHYAAAHNRRTHRPTDANANTRTGRLWSQVRHSRNSAQRVSTHLNASLSCRQPFDYFERYCAMCRQATDLGWGGWGPSRYEVHAERGQIHMRGQTVSNLQTEEGKVSEIFCGNAGVIYGRSPM